MNINVCPLSLNVTKCEIVCGSKANGEWVFFTNLKCFFATSKMNLVLNILSPK